MSASRKKRERKLLEAENANLSGAKKSKKEKTGVDKALRDVLIIIGILALVAAIIVIAVSCHNSSRRNAVIATVGSHEIKTPMMNYAYMDSVNSFYSNYSSYISIFLDPSKPLAEQECTMDPDSSNWGEYFANEAAKAMEQYYNIYDYAAADSFTLSDEEKASIDETIESLKSYTELNGSNADSYLERVYGDGCTVENYKEYLTLQKIAQSYYQAYCDSIEVSDEDAAEKYAEDPSAFDGVTYYMVSKNAAEFVEKNEDGTAAAGATDEDREEAKKAAEEIKANFDVSELSATEDSVKSSIASVCTEEAAEWLFDDSRKEGDVEMFATEDGNSYYVVRFVEKDRHEFATANCKIIVIEPDAVDDAEALFNEVKGEITAENIDSVAEEHGLNAIAQENLGRSGLGDDVDAWLLDAGRKAGDVEGFEVDSHYYIFLYEGAGELYKDTLVKNSIASELQQQWQEDHAHTNAVVVNKDNLNCLNLNLVLSEVFAS